MSELKELEHLVMATGVMVGVILVRISLYLFEIRDILRDKEGR